MNEKVADVGWGGEERVYETEGGAVDRVEEVDTPFEEKRVEFVSVPWLADRVARVRRRPAHQPGALSRQAAVRQRWFLERYLEVRARNDRGIDSIEWVPVVLVASVPLAAWSLLCIALTAAGFMSVGNMLGAIGGVALVLALIVAFLVGGFQALKFIVTLPGDLIRARRLGRRPPS